MTRNSEDQTSFEMQAAAKPKGAVECFGLTFGSDDERRDHFLEELREKLKDPAFRKIEGFPIGSDEDILALSDPPYYTACPNPFIGDFIMRYGKPYDTSLPYSREPFAADVSEGKNDPIYNAHSYHTKVPHKAIMHYIFHYTEPGDLVFDGFCGTGMTGLAAQLCGDENAVKEIGYSIRSDGSVFGNDGVPVGRFGVRYAILKDLSPAATNIARTYNLPLPASSVLAESRRLLSELKRLCGWMYETLDPKTKQLCPVTYTIWSDVFLCPNCSSEIVFYDVAVDAEKEKVRDEFSCPHCEKEHLSKDDLTRFQESRFDPIRQGSHSRAKRVPVLIEYMVGTRRFTKAPDKSDLDTFEEIEKRAPEWFFPDCRIDRDIDLWYERDYRALGVDNVYDFFTRRALLCLSTFRMLLTTIVDSRTRAALTWVFTSVVEGSSLMNRERPGGMPSKLSGTLYIGALIREINPISFLERKVHKLLSLDLPRGSDALIETASSNDCSGIGNNTVDYIFVDPPFGSNIIYSDLSILWEAWLNVFTNTKQEAVVHRRKRTNASTLEHYIDLMSSCFCEMFRMLKPGRWITVEFHNTKNSVWNAIQESLFKAGFVVADVRTLDKQQGSFKQVTAAGAVKQDLIISAYKPNGGLEDRFKLEAGTLDGVWDFLRTHLKHLPVFVSKKGQAEIISERQNYLLFDRMVAFHVQRGVRVPLSASEFYAGLVQRFSERDGMFFLSEQLAEYDMKRMTVREVLQLQLFVIDEASAIQWLKQQFVTKPQTFQDIHPQFLRELGGWQKYEKPLELSELLEQNFLRFDGAGLVPEQIHAYLSSNWAEMRKRDKDDPALRLKAKDRWYVPDPNKAGDLEKLRERSLLREFWDYLPPGYRPAKPDSQQGFIPGLEPKAAPISKGKRIKLVRLEAVRCGFKHCWQNRDYPTIIAVAQRISEDILQEDPKLLMWYDQALTRQGEK
jgi:DNA modification methylase